MIELRPYQKRAIDEAREAFRTERAVLFQLPTGGGKTVTASTVVHGAAQKRNRVWWLTHRRELAAQASRTFYDLGIPHGLIQAGTVTDPNALVQVASIQTIARRLDKLPQPALIVFDEAHHIGAAQWDQVFNHHKRAKFREQGRAGSLDDLIQLGRERGYKSPEFWARKVWASRQGMAAA